jgi:hypothetical protein
LGGDNGLVEKKVKGGQWTTFVCSSLYERCVNVGIGYSAPGILKEKVYSFEVDLPNLHQPNLIKLLHMFPTSSMYTFLYVILLFISQIINDPKSDVIPESDVISVEDLDQGTGSDNYIEFS